MKIPCEHTHGRIVARGYVTDLTGVGRDSFVAEYGLAAAVGMPCGCGKTTEQVRTLIVFDESQTADMRRNINAAGALMNAPDSGRWLGLTNSLVDEALMLERVVSEGFGFVIVHDMPVMERINWRRFAHDADCSVMLSHDGNFTCDARFVVRLFRMTKGEAKRAGVKFGDIKRYVRLNVKENYNV